MLTGKIQGRVYVIVYTVRVCSFIVFQPAGPTLKRQRTMSITRIKMDLDDPSTFPEGRIEPLVVDSTTEAKIAQQEQADEAEVLKDMARYARRIRRRMGLSQTELARRIAVSPETIRNWEQGKRCPTGAARALLRLLDKAPETALRVLT